MADRALGEDEPGGPREVFELDKDERWQARLEEARARREIALREKAAGKSQPRPKPWEEEGATPIPEPIIQERGDDKFDFADRLHQLKGDEAAGKAGERAAPPAAKPEDTEGTPRPRKSSPKPVAGARRPTTPAPTDRPPAGEAIERLRPPGTTTSKPGAASSASPPRRARPMPSLVVPGAPDVAEIAQRYADTLNPDPEHLPEPTQAAPVAEKPARKSTRSGSGLTLTLPTLSSRPGVRPLGMALGLLALSALPLTTLAPPLEKGPPMPIVASFPVQPALGVTWSLYARPQETRSGEWRAKIVPSRLAVPAIGPSVPFQGEIVLPDAPGAGDGSSLAWTGVDAPPSQQVKSELGRPTEAPDRPEPVASPPPPRDGLLVPDRRPAPARPATLKEAMEQIARREAEAAGEGVAAAPETTPENTGPAAPPSSALRVTILTPPLADKSVAEAFAADVPLKGHELVRVLEVDYPISTRNIRYFHEEDRAEAARLAREYDAELRDFTWFRPSPVAGTTELWLSGSAGEEPSTPAPRRNFVPEVFDVEPLILPPPRQVPARSGALLNRVMEGVGDALGASLGLPRRGN